MTAQWIIVGLIVIAAAAWTVWNLALRGVVRRARAAKAGGPADGGCAPDCACGD